MEEIKNSTDLEDKSAFLTYLLAQKSLTPEEANSHAVDLMMGAVETVSTTNREEFIHSLSFEKVLHAPNIPLDNQNQTL